ncbi:hypothetical protein L6164_024611 [Bauhinia variegata]|uniref:Uncharacterized protein n=1 Tax=Bauhinia variegata TaxID=167791 RepID=A0ACB9LZH4_BAUVA|nr:hypothetical protein L6164_024611 [Bauhinia variegata]
MFKYFSWNGEWQEGHWVLPMATCLFLILIVFVLLISKLFLKRQGNHPPSPPSLPVIGHLYLLKEPLHRSLHKLAEKYGPIIFLRFGARNVLVVSSPAGVEECFMKNDITFADRPLTLAGKHLNYNSKTVGFLSYGDHWRKLRRLTTLELFSVNSLAVFTGIREDEVRLLVKHLFQDCCGGGVRVEMVEIDLRERFVELSFNIMLRMISGKRYYGKDVVAQEAKEFQILIKEYAELLGSGNLNDFLPLLHWVDFGGVEKRMMKLMNKMNRFLQNLLDEHKRNWSMSLNGSNIHSQRKMTLIEVMLQLQETDPEFYTDENIKAVILAMLVAGSETSATTMEWAMSLLLNHPESLQKARAEIDTNVGQEQLVKESDLPKLNYLENVITETLRLFPVAPLLLPHQSSKDCTVCGFNIPGGTMLFVNLWAMHRDAKVWFDPTRFMPERYEGIEAEGYKMIPFGAGRRACPGAGLAKRVMVQALGALIQSFEWKKIGHEQVNMMERTGLTTPKVEPLVALCKPRQVMLNILSNL